MKQRFKALFFGGIPALVLFGIAVAGQLDDGQAAIERGDYTTAMRLLRPLADRGDTKAQYNLGWMYDNGQGVARDYALALVWYRKAADLDNADAQYNLGLLYAHGQGVPQDYAQAVMWFRKSADLDNAYAQFDLGWMYAYGQGVG
jgi:uncharacterized protein